VDESIMLLLLLPPALPTRLQYYCDTIARYSNPLRPPVFMPYTIQYCAQQYRVRVNPGALLYMSRRWLEPSSFSTASIGSRPGSSSIYVSQVTRTELLLYWFYRLTALRGQSRIRYSLPALGFGESGIHLASPTGKPLGIQTYRDS